MKISPVLAAALTVLCALPASAENDAGLDLTFGSAHYFGAKLRGTLELKNDVYVAPSVQTYRSDVVGGTYRNFAVRAGQDRRPLSWSGDLSYLPKTNGYSRAGFGGDATYELLPNKDGDSSAEKAEIGAAFEHLEHYDDSLPAGSTPQGRRGRGAPRTSRLAIGQNDLSALAGASASELALDGRVTKSLYSANLDAANARVAQALALPGFGPVVQGFPDTSENLKLRWRGKTLIRPYVSYTHTTFKLAQTASNAYELGASSYFDKFSLKAAYERYLQSGFSDQNFVTIGATAYF